MKWDTGGKMQAADENKPNRRTENHRAQNGASRTRLRDATGRVVVYA